MAHNLIHLQKVLFVRSILFILIIFLLTTELSGQKDTLIHKADTLPDRFYLLQKVERDGVTLPEVQINEVNIINRRTRSQRSALRQYDRLVVNIKRVYPYAVIVREKLGQVNTELEGLENDRERRKYLKGVEQEVFKDYEGDMRKMTITQGRLLIKLIDRETQNTSFELIKLYRGSFSAAFWQGIARIFGTNLKEEYDAYGNDLLIELIINEIDAGRL